MSFLLSEPLPFLGSQLRPCPPVSQDLSIVLLPFEKFLHHLQQ